MSKMLKLVWLVPLLPFAGFLINGLLRNYLAKAITAIIGCGVLLASFIISLMIFFEVKNGQTGVVELFDFISVGKLSIPFAFQIDQLSSLFLLIITGVGFLIRIPEPVCVFHAYSCAGFKLPDHVYWLGGCWTLLLSSYRLLV
jgi:NADH-quinone oxidoreductase subunit L